MSNIFFDWSGTIKDAFTSHHWVVNKIFKKCGINEISRESLKAEWSEPYMNFFNKYLPSLTLEEETQMYSGFVNDLSYPKSNPIDGMVDVVRKLKLKNNKLYLVTADIYEAVHKEIEEYKLTDIFEEVFSQTYDKSIPITETINKNKLVNSDTYLIGDSINEIKVAKKVGIKSLAVTWGFTPKEKLIAEKPDFIIDHSSDMLDLLK